jgi:ATPase subunit of ABC transporter with duplicated ATPase domains
MPRVLFVQKPKISALLNVQALQYPVSHNPHFAQVRLKTLSREIPKVAGQMQHHDKEREKKERREREKREKDEKKREKERSKLEKKREKGMKKGMRLPGKKIGKADLKKELKREMQKEWEEELERESVRGRDTRPSVAEASSMIPASPPTADATTTSSNVEPLHSSVKRPVARRRLEPRFAPSLSMIRMAPCAIGTHLHSHISTHAV